MKNNRFIFCCESITFFLIVAITIFTIYLNIQYNFDYAITEKYNFTVQCSDKIVNIVGYVSDSTNKVRTNNNGLIVIVTLFCFYLFCRFLCRVVNYYVLKKCNHNTNINDMCKSFRWTLILTISCVTSYFMFTADSLKSA